MRHIWEDYDGTLFVPKEQSRIMRLIDWALRVTRINTRFTHFWTTIRWPFQKKSRIYFPPQIGERCPWDEDFAGIVAHERVHVRQWDHFGASVYWALLYTILPLPVYWSGRWWMERPAYLADLKAGRYETVEAAAWALYHYYGRPYPLKRMEAWFRKHLELLHAPDARK